MSTVLLTILGYLGGDLVGLILARLGVSGFGAIAARKAAQAAPSLVRSALERILHRSDRDLPDAERSQHQTDRELVRAAAGDWFPERETP